jgi:6-phosphogluconolactonase
VNFGPEGKRVYAADLGIDQVRMYDYDPGKGALTPSAPASVPSAPGAGPRHLSFHPSGRFAYVVNELGNTVSAYERDAATGALERRADTTTLPDGFQGDSFTAEIRVHPSGRFLYASNRGHDSIAVFSLDDPGSPRKVGHVATGGKTPRNFALDPSGRYLLAANQESNNVVVFRVHPETGLPEATGEQAACPKPVCVLFVASCSN